MTNFNSAPGNSETRPLAEVLSIMSHPDYVQHIPGYAVEDATPEEIVEIEEQLGVMIAQTIGDAERMDNIGHTARVNTLSIAFSLHTDHQG